MKSFLKFLSAFLALSLVICNIQPTFASNLNNLKGKKSDLSDQAKRAKDLLNDTTVDKNETTKEILVLDAELDDISDEYFTINDELEATTLFLEQTELDLKNAETRHEIQYEVLRARIRAMHESGELSYFDILFKAENFADLLNSAEYVNRIVEYDNNMVTELQSTEDFIAENVKEIELKKSEIEVLAKNLEVKKVSLEGKIFAKRKMLDELTQTEKQYLEDVESLENADKEITGLIKNAEVEAAKKAEADKAAAEAAAKKTAAAKDAARKAASATKKPSSTPAPKQKVDFNGKLGWPVQGFTQINSSYGYRKHPIYGKSKLHAGVDIDANTGTNILAAESGTVISAKYMSGYGYTVIIEHGGGISTLYGHNSKNIVSAGQSVKRGQIIAKAGSTGAATGPHCHFEVRINGVHTNPRSYLGY